MSELLLDCLKNKQLNLIYKNQLLKNILKSI